MKAKWKQFMAVLLIVSLVLGICPSVAEAEEITQDLSVQTVVNAGENTEETPEQAEEKTTEAATEEMTTEAMIETSTEEDADSPGEEQTAGGTEKTPEQAEEQEPSGGQEETPAAPVQEQPEEDQEVFRPVEKHTLYCKEDTRVYEEADTASAVAEVLTEGEAFDVTAETDTWYQVLYGTGQKQGFVKKKEGSFTQERPERRAAIVEEEEEEMVSLLASSSSKMIYSDGSWSGGTIWYVDDTNKHYIFCLNHGATMYSGKYYGRITTGYSGYDAFRIAAALNYFKKQNGGYGKKDYYGEVQNAIWDTGSSGLLTYIKHAWKLADNNGSRSAGSSSYDSKLKAVGADSTTGLVSGLKAQKVSSSGGVIDKTISLSGSAWKYFAKGEFPGGSLGSTGAGSDTIRIAGVYDKDGKEVSYDKNSNYVGTDGKLHIRLATDPQTEFGTEKNPATILMRVYFPYEGADQFRYLLTDAGKQNLTYDTEADTMAYFAIKVYTDDTTDYETPVVSINKVDESGNPVSGCTFRVKGISGDALTKKYDSGDVIVDSTDDVFEIKYAGTYSIQETAVPANGEYKLNTDVATFTAEWGRADENGVSKLEIKDSTSPDILISGNWRAESDNNMKLTYTCTNESTEGAAVLTKYGNMLVSYQDGKFVYEKKVLEGAEFGFYAAEDIYCGDTLVFRAGTKITDGMGWGKLLMDGGGNLPDLYKHTVEISGSKTGKDGRITISGLPAGDYYAVETGTPAGFEKATEHFNFTVIPDKTVQINGTGGIINEVAPAVCHVFKVDADTKQPLNGGEFTIYADVANTDFDGKPLFGASDTVPAVTARNLATGDETVEEGRWVPIQTVTTKEGGMAEFDDLPRGRYLVAETKAPVMEDGRSYELAEESYIFVHDGKSNASSNGYNFEHTFEDARSKDYRILKHVETAARADDGTKDVFVFSDEPAAGAVFGIYAAEDIYNTAGKPAWKADQQITSVTTNAEGIAAYSGVLFSGKYYFKELKTPDDGRYILDETEYPFTVDADNPGGMLTEKPLINKLYKGSIKVIKTDGKTKYPLEGVEFNLLDHDKQVLGTFVTDENGEILIEGLPVDTYYVQETKTLKGYKLTDELAEVVITPEELDKTVEVTNDRNDTSITIRPNTSIDGHGGVKTGDSGLSGFIMGMFFLFALSLAGLFMKKKAGNRRKWKERLAVFRWDGWLIKKPLLIFGIVVLGSILAGLSVKAAAEWKETASRELTDAEYNGTIYTYAVEKQLEVPDKDTDVTAYFEEVVAGMELSDISCEVIDTVPAKEIRVLEETKDYKELTPKDEAKIAETLDVGGETYTLKDITWSGEPNIEHVDYTVEYGYRTEEPKPAETYEYTYTSPVTKKENTVTLPFIRLEQGDTTWADGFSAIVTLHNLDGGYFTLGDHEFAYNKDSISFSTSDYAELIRMLGYDTSKYRLTSAKWQGKEYKDKDGIRCRDAYVSGQQYAASYKALYEGDVENGTLYTAHATYTLEQEVETGEAESYILKATGYYEKTGVWHNIISFVTEHEAVSAVSAGLLLLCVILAVVVLMRRKRKTSKIDEKTDE